MGATGWHYTTPYDPDPESALQRLREETFVAGDYLQPGGIMRFPRDRDLPPGTPFGLRLIMSVMRMIAAISVAAHWFARGGRNPRSIDELLAMTGENGTHSILDITHTSDIPKPGAASPLSKHRHLKFFGTTTPTRARIDRAMLEPEGQFDDDIRRWEAVYFVIHDELGTPLDYMFVGISGD